MHTSTGRSYRPAPNFNSFIVRVAPGRHFMGSDSAEVKLIAWYPSPATPLIGYRGAVARSNWIQLGINDARSLQPQKVFLDRRHVPSASAN
uniref:3-methyladenine DNA glycosylase n=1 Tax=Steinernema glaseri TaxID=37863 RepID=A0A1I7YPP1_9BILA